MLTKKDRQHLKAIAKALPLEKSETKETVKMLGGQMLRLNPIAMDKNGKPIIRNKFYEVQQFKPVNHYTKMLAAYDHGGIPAVEKYTEEVKQRWEEQQKVKEN